MSKAIAGERRVAKRRLCLDERASRHAFRLRESEEDIASRRVAGASQQDGKTL
jgi:hypothetical protein